MARLTIPMRTGQTIRPGRRRVVLSLVLLFVGAVCAWGFGQMIVKRTTLASLVPEDAAFIDVVGRHSLDLLLQKLGNATLLSDRPVTLSMLSPYLGREAGVAMLSDGQRVVFISGSLPEDVQKQLESVGVRARKVGSMTVLYRSDATIDSLRQTSHPRLSLRSLWPGFSGWFKDGDKQQTLYINQFGLGSGRRPAQAVSEMTDTSSEILAIVDFDEQNSLRVGPLLAFSTLKNELMEIIEGKSGRVLVVKDSQGIGYAVTVHATVGTDQLAKMLQQMAYVDIPLIVEASLEDGTKVQELTADDQDLHVSIVDQGEDTVLMVDRGDKHWRAWKRQQQITVSNREQLPAVDFFDDRGVSFVRLAELVGFISEQPVIHATDLQPLLFFKEIDIFKDNFVICW